MYYETVLWRVLEMVGVVGGGLLKEERTYIVKFKDAFASLMWGNMSVWFLQFIIEKSPENKVKYRNNTINIPYSSIIHVSL